MATVPRSVLDEVGGMHYLPRMLDKIRLHSRGELPADYHSSLGKGADGWCLNFLRIDYSALCDRVLAGGSDAEIFEWCGVVGRRPNADDLLVWNGFISKLGWNDFATGRLNKYKAAAGLAEREDVRTMADFFDIDEGRKK